MKLVQINMPVDCLQLPQLAISRFEPAIHIETDDGAGASMTLPTSNVRLPRLLGRPPGSKVGVLPVTVASTSGPGRTNRQANTYNRLRTVGVPAKGRTSTSVNDNDTLVSRIDDGNSGSKSGDKHNVGEVEAQVDVHSLRLPLSSSGEQIAVNITSD